MTGRGAGYCAGYAMPGYDNHMGGRWFGAGGRGGGRGYRNMFHATGQPRWARWGGYGYPMGGYGYGYPMGGAGWGAWGMPPMAPVWSPEQETEALKQQAAMLSQQAEMLGQQLEAINKRLAELEDQS